MRGKKEAGNVVGCYKKGAEYMWVMVGKGRNTSQRQLRYASEPGG